MAGCTFGGSHRSSLTGGVTAQDQQPQLQTPEGAVTVNDLAGNPREHLGRVQLVGVVAAVSQRERICAGGQARVCRLRPDLLSRTRYEENTGSLERRHSKAGTNRPCGGHLAPEREGPEFRCTGDRHPVIVRRLLPAVVFVAIFVAHALYFGCFAASAPSGWTDFTMSANAAGPLGLGAYWRGQDYFVGFSYALGAAFATWLSRSIFSRRCWPYM